MILRRKALHFHPGRTIGSIIPGIGGEIWSLMSPLFTKSQVSISISKLLDPMGGIVAI